MNTDPTPAEPQSNDSASVPTTDLVTIAIEHWRLSTWIETVDGNIGTGRHALRRMADVLARWQVETRSLSGRPFDPGLAARVIDTMDDPTIPIGNETVDETISPMVLWHGNVIRPAEIVVRRGVGKSNRRN